MLTSIALAFKEGGFWMWPILGLGLATIAISAERFYALFMKRKINQRQVADSFEDSIRRGELDRVIEQARSQEGAVARATLAGARAARALGGKEEIQGKMDEVLITENGNLDRRVGFLSMLGNVATLTGLLGTITGMIKSFAAVSYANPAEKAALLAHGISEAMNCTAFGLVVAIPAILMYSILQNRANRLAEDMNQSALRVFNWLSYAFEPAGMKPFRAADKRTPEINA
ncbi:MAG: MotA/TolQ/ExbB proton channel family protein [Bdellovibrionales bacterium]|nr:MotA/TolQ/ExbB proton channel family protein [Bdellovibrionales bacterium]